MRASLCASNGQLGRRIGPYGVRIRWRYRQAHFCAGNEAGGAILVKRRWGTFRQEPERDTISCHLAVREGRVKLQTFTLTGFGSARLKTPRSAAGGEAVSFSVQRDCFSDLA